MSRPGHASGYKVRRIDWPETKEQEYFRGRESVERIREACDAKASVRLLPKAGDTVFVSTPSLLLEKWHRLKNTEATVVGVDRTSGLVTVRYKNPKPSFGEPEVIEDTFRGDHAFMEP